jgi:predicted transcriptional regulator
VQLERLPVEPYLLHAPASGNARREQWSVSQWYHVGMALTLRTDEELEQALAALSESEGLSRQEVIRRAVLERYERAGHASRVAESADRMIERWGDVIDRLGTV